MNHRIGVSGGAGERLELAQPATQHRPAIGLDRGRQRVGAGEPRHLMARRDQLSRHAAAHKSTRACHENTHWLSSFFVLGAPT